MTEEKQIEELLINAHNYGIREEVIQYANHLREINIKITRIRSYELAYDTLLEILNNE